MIALPVVIHAQSHFAYQEKNKNFFVKNEYSTAHFAGGCRGNGPHTSNTVKADIGYQQDLGKTPKSNV
jgi:hypothetical protein